MKYILILIYIYGGDPVMVVTPGEYDDMNDCKLSGLAVKYQPAEGSIDFLCLPGPI